MISILTSIIPRKTKTIDELRVGSAFMRANHNSPKEATIIDPTTCRIYLKMPNSPRSVGDLCAAGVVDTKRIGYCLQGKNCAYIEPNEPLYEVDLHINAEVQI